MKLPHFISKVAPGYRVIDLKEWRKSKKIEIYLEKRSRNKLRKCSRCSNELKNSFGKYRLILKHLPIFDQECFLILWREKGYCSKCKKVRAEKIDIVSKDSPHITQEYAFWLSRLFEMSSVKKTAELTKSSQSSLHRLDFNRLKRMIQNYEIPDVKEISVDEVHARSKKNFKKESRQKLFFTVVTDLKSRKDIWVSESRTQEGLSEFFLALGKERCKKIKVVATDQHNAYRLSVKKHCPEAKLVWDKFHLIQNFEKVLDDTRGVLHDRSKTSEERRLTRGKWRFAFLRKASRRTKEEHRHIQEVVKDNESFFYLEIIKERFFQYFYASSANEAYGIFIQIGKWIEEAGFEALRKWWYALYKNWEIMKNYFEYRVTTALSEGTNTVIKMLKRRGFGYKNMVYFRLKIMQVCGYLNSKYIPMEF